jgi:hypothetical protein
MPDNNQMVTFADLQGLIDNDGFLQNNPFTPTDQLADKLEVIDALVIDEALLDGLEDNQMVQLSLIEKGDAPVDNPPTPPNVVTVIGTSVDKITIQWSGATDDHGIASYIVGGKYVPNPDPYWFPDFIPGTEDTFTLYAMNPDTDYNIWVKSVDTIGQESIPSTPIQGSTDPLGNMNSVNVSQSSAIPNDACNDNSLTQVWFDGTLNHPVVGDRFYHTDNLNDPIINETGWIHIPIQTGVTVNGSYELNSAGVAISALSC